MFGEQAFVQAADEECAKLGSMVQRLNTSSKQLSAGCSAAAKGLSKNTTDMIAQFIKHFC